MMARLNSGFRSEESPMDFKWDNNQGPVEHDSPFVQGAAQGWKSNTFAGFKRKSIVSAFVVQGHDTDAQYSEGPAQDLDSPMKPSLPALRDPENQTYLYSATPSSKPIRNLSFTTPQRSIETDFSSGPDMSSPANADTEATPDPPARSVLSQARRTMVQFKSDKETSSGGLHDNSLKSGRGEIIRKHFPDGAHRRVSKRRRRDVDKDVQLAPRRADNDSDFEERPSSSEGSQRKAPPVRPMGLVPSVLTFIDAHPSLPNTLSFYVQFLLNCFFAFCMMYVLYGFYSTICHDIEERAMMESSDILAEMAACAHEFKENRCDRDSRVPAMETVCNNWEKCMQRDPLKVGRSRLSAGMFAEIFNGFIEPISLKAIIVSLTVIVGCFAVNNLTFGLWRAKTHQSPAPPPYTPHARPPPQQPMDWQMPNQHYYAPYQNYVGMHGVGTDPRGYQLEGQSPTKRLDYR